MAILSIPEVPQELVTRFLEEQGVDRGVVTRKYFRRSPGFDGLNAYVLMDSESVVGFLGIVPFRIESDGTAYEASWTCDWYVDRSVVKGPSGLMLIMHAIRNSDHLVHIGGEEITRQVYSRVARGTVENAVNVLHANLAVGGVVRRIARRMGKPDLNLGPFERIPLTRPRANAKESARIDDGVPANVGGVFDRHDPGECHPKYRHSYVQWLLDEDPSIQSFCVSTADDPADSPTGVFWTSSSAGGFWRMALLGHAKRGNGLEGVVGAGLAEVVERGGVAVRTVVTHGDDELFNALRRSGFRAHSSLPYHIVSNRSPELPLERLCGFSYLDSDWATRFE